MFKITILFLKFHSWMALLPHRPGFLFGTIALLQQTRYTQLNEMFDGCIYLFMTITINSLTFYRRVD